MLNKCSKVSHNAAREEIRFKPAKETELFHLLKAGFGVIL
jgi:hypothetical protein